MDSFEQLRCALYATVEGHIRDTGQICPPDCEISRDERFCVCERLPAQCWIEWFCREGKRRQGVES